MLAPLTGMGLSVYARRIGRSLNWPILVVNGALGFGTCCLAGPHSPAFIFGINFLLFVSIAFTGVDKLVASLLCLGVLLAGCLFSDMDRWLVWQGFIILVMYVSVLNQVLGFVIQQAVEIDQTKTALSVEKEKTEQLLLNILPGAIADRFKEDHSPLADGFASVTVLFADIVGFTTFSRNLAPRLLVTFLNELYSRFDGLVEELGLEKIKTIDDAYMVAGGVPTPLEDHAQRMCILALKMREAVSRIPGLEGLPHSIRIGISTGPVTAGVIGVKKFTYDLWGDTINTAGRMESHSEAGKIHITDEVYQLIHDRFVCQPRQPMEVKGKGWMKTWFLESVKTG